RLVIIPTHTFKPYCRVLVMTTTSGQYRVNPVLEVPNSPTFTSPQQKHLIHSMDLNRVESLVTRFVAPGATTLSQYFYPATHQHLPQIIEMRQKVVKRSTEEDEKYLRWRYRFSGSSNADSLAENHIRIFCKDGEVLGFVGVEASTLCIPGRTIPVLKVMDLMVAPDLDRRGLGVWMNLKLQSLGLPVIALGSNR